MKGGPKNPFAIKARKKAEAIRKLRKKIAQKRTQSEGLPPPATFRVDLSDVGHYSFAGSLAHINGDLATFYAIDSPAHAETISRAALIEFVKGLATSKSVRDNLLKADGYIVDSLADLSFENLDRGTVLGWAIKGLTQIADNFKDIVAERRHSLGNMALVERRIDRTQQETAQILGNFV